jgi:hypothetical protein
MEFMKYLVAAGGIFAAGMGVGEVHGYLSALRQPPITHIQVSAYDPKLRPTARVFYADGKEGHFSSIDAGVMVPHAVAVDIRKGFLTLDDYLHNKKVAEPLVPVRPTPTYTVERSPRGPVEDRRVMLAIKEDEEPLDEAQRKEVNDLDNGPRNKLPRNNYARKPRINRRLMPPHQDYRQPRAVRRLI